MMFVILCYDVGIKRNAKVKKTVRKYLRPVQKSVCEGFITEAKLNKLCAQLKHIVDPEEDAIAIYTTETVAVFEKRTIGQTLDNEDFIL